MLQTQTALYEPPTARNAEQKKRQYDIDPKLTRYIFIPLQSLVDQISNAFYVNEIPANTFFPLYEFDFPVPVESGGMASDDLTLRHLNGSKLSLRTPGEQIVDLQRTIGSRLYYNFFADFIEVAKLDDKAKAKRIFETLKPKSLCSKYAFELKDTCLTCWLDYLNNEADAVIEEAFADDFELSTIAKLTKGQLGEVIFRALSQADVEVAEALRQMDDKTTGKTNLVDLDYQSIYHAHKERPKFRTTTDNQQDLHEVLKTLQGVISNSQPAQNNDNVLQQVAQMMAEQEAKAKAREKALLDEIEALKGKTAPVAEKAVVEPETVYNIGDKVIYDGQEWTVIAKPFGKIKLSTQGDEDGAVVTVAKEQLNGNA